MTTVDDVRAIVFDIGGTLLNPADGNLTEFRRVLHGVVDEKIIATIVHPGADKTPYDIEHWAPASVGGDLLPAGEAAVYQ